ncbi:hypothetical protein N9Y33_04230 [Bacteroidia bacterium]|nr:hypothetical protein [Bacteroidia bacterium]
MNTNPISELEIGMVVFGKPKKYSKYFGGISVDVINNKPNDLGFGRLGENRLFEFGAFEDLMLNFKSDGPYLLLNDTFFSNHVSGFWMMLIKQWSKELIKKPVLENIIYGDVRLDGDALKERPGLFLSSWIFMIPNRRALTIFLESLLEVTRKPIPVKHSPEYELFLTLWLQSKHPLRGWQGVRTKENLFRKRTSIYIEHRWSAHATEKGLELVSLGVNNQILYACIRILDRALARFRAFRNYARKLVTSKKPQNNASE